MKEKRMSKMSPTGSGSYLHSKDVHTLSKNKAVSHKVKPFKKSAEAKKKVWTGTSDGVMKR